MQILNYGKLAQSLIDTAIATNNHPFSILREMINILKQTDQTLTLKQTNRIEQKVRDIIISKNDNLPWKLR